MQKTWPLIIVLLLLFTAAAPDPGDEATSGQGLLFDPISITAEMSSDGTTLITIEARVTNIGNTSRSTIAFRLESLRIIRISAQVDGNDADPLVVPIERHSIVVVPIPDGLDINQSRWVSLEIESGDLQTAFMFGNETQNQQGSLLFYLRLNSRVANLTFTAILPVHASLNRDSITPLFPSTNENFTNGESLVFVWSLDEVLPDEEILFIVSYEIPYASPAQEGFPITLAFLVGLLSGLGLLGIVAFRPSFPSKKERSPELPFAGLTTEEETILTLIQNKGGSCSQKELYTQLSISESKISLILRNLEERDLVRRFRSGRENTVHLVESTQIHSQPI